MTAPTYCDGHDAPAVSEAWWIDMPGTRDERGASTPFCPDPACRDRVLAMIEHHGTLQEVRPC